MDSVKVKYPNRMIGEQVREFSLAVHGEQFAELAKEFAETNNGTIITDGEIVSQETIPAAEGLPAVLEELTLEEPAEPDAGIALEQCDKCEKMFKPGTGIAVHKRSHKDEEVLPA